jgi:perosamine synthetase
MNKLALLGGQPVCSRPFPPPNSFGEEELANVKEVLASGVLSGFIARGFEAFGGGRMVKRLEAAFCERFGAKYAIAVNSNTSGLHAAVAAIGIEPGDEVIVPPYTMSATAAAVLHANGVPVFADVETETYGLDPTDVERKITRRTKAIMPVHLFGHPCRMDELLDIARRYGLRVIEDAAQSPGAVYRGRETGTIGDLGVFSLNQNKTITTGEGGVVLTNDRELALRAQLVRNHGEVCVEDLHYDNIPGTLGWNYRMTELEAAVGVAQLDRLDALNALRQDLAEYLTEKMRGMPGIRAPIVRTECTHVYFCFPMRYEAHVTGLPRSLFVKAMAAEGVGVGAGYVAPLYREPMYRRLQAYDRDRGFPFTYNRAPEEVPDYSDGICPNCEALYESDLLLHFYCRHPLTRSDMDDVLAAMEKVLAGREALLATQETPVGVGA